MSFAIARATQDTWLRRSPAPESRTPPRFAGGSAEGLRLQRCACGGSCPACRAKAAALPINTPGDAWEREADAAADAVMRGGVAGSVSAGGAAISRLQRCACGGSCPACRAKKEEEALRREDAGGGGAPGFAPSIVHDVVGSAGRPLDAGARGFMERRFGADFGGVRVHDDARAAESARAVDAHAYTVGDHVVFGAGRYAPGTPGGDRLLAHELAHTLQQGGTAAGATRQVSRYRKQGSPNFGACDQKGKLEESEYTAGKPYINRITVEFTSFIRYQDGDVAPKGTLSATYHKDAAAAIQGVSILGGYASEGFSNEGVFTVPRIEGCGYNRDAVDKADRLQHKASTHYHTPDKVKSANMSFAIFFYPEKFGKQAIHRGSLSTGSMACVHVSSADELQKLNYHSREGVTKVEIKYSDKIRTDICCVRKRYEPNAGNPCGKVKASSCPKTAPTP